MAVRRARRRRSTAAVPRRRSSKYKRAINIKQAGLGYAGLSVLTGGAFNVNPIEFVMGVTGKGLSGGFGSASGITKISLSELFQWPEGGVTLNEQLMKNLKKNGFKIVGGLITIKAADYLIKNLGIARTFNKGVRALNMGGLVKM